MALARFSIIVAVDGAGGISKNGEVPWQQTSHSKFFRETTIGRGRNAIIMGRNTYESIPDDKRPLEGRHNVVISRTMRQENHPHIKVCENLIEALSVLGSASKSYDEVFIAGGEQIYQEAVTVLGYLCNKIYVTKLKTDYKCDQFFPWETVCKMKQMVEPQKTRDYTRYVYSPLQTHPEHEYLDALADLIDHGDKKVDGNNVGVVSNFGLKLTLEDIGRSLPIITTRRIDYDVLIKELIFFISGNTDANILKSQGVSSKFIDDTTREKLDEFGFDEREVGDLGPFPGFQLRHFGDIYEGSGKQYGIDQLSELIRNIRTNPQRTHVISLLNINDVKMCVSEPSVCLVQFSVSSDRKFLDCQLYVSTEDLFLDTPLTIATYGLLLHMIGLITNIKPRKLIIVVGESYVVTSNIDKAKRQLGRTPRPFPTLSFRGSAKLHEMDHFTYQSFIIEGYQPCAAITAKN